MAIRENLLIDSDVCVPGSTLTIPDEDATRTATQFKALGDSTRLRIMQILAANGSVCACDLEEPLGLSQSTVSHHLRQLTDAGLISREKRGTWAFFSVAHEGVTNLALGLGNIATSA